MTDTKPRKSGQAPPPARQDPEPGPVPNPEAREVRRLLATAEQERDKALADLAALRKTHDEQTGNLQERLTSTTARAEAAEDTADGLRAALAAANETITERETGADRYRAAAEKVNDGLRDEVNKLSAQLAEAKAALQASDEARDVAERAVTAFKQERAAFRAHVKDALAQADKDRRTAAGHVASRTFRKADARRRHAAASARHEALAEIAGKVEPS